MHFDLHLGHLESVAVDTAGNPLRLDEDRQPVLCDGENEKPYVGSFYLALGVNGEVVIYHGKNERGQGISKLIEVGAMDNRTIEALCRAQGTHARSAVAK